MKPAATERTSPSQARDARRRVLSRFLDRVRVEEDFSQEELATAVGARPKKGHFWCNRDHKEVPLASDIAALPRPVAIRIVRWLADQLELVLTVRPTTEAELPCHHTQLATWLKEGAEAKAAYAVALADGHIDDAELAAIDAELRDEETEAAKLRGWVNGEMRRRGLVGHGPSLRVLGRDGKVSG